MYLLHISPPASNNSNIRSYYATGMSQKARIAYARTRPFSKFPDFPRLPLTAGTMEAKVNECSANFCFTELQKNKHSMCDH